MRMGDVRPLRPSRTARSIRRYEATIVNALADLAEKKQLYKGLRSTLWCVHDETALAEAEIEYEPKISPSIYVRFTANDAQRASDPRSDSASGDARAMPALSVLIWTTTPWTLPANVAIALRADATYGLYRLDDECVDPRDGACAEQALGERFADARAASRSVPASELDGLAVRHPFMDRDSRRRARRLRRSRNRNRRGAHRARATAPTTSTPA